MATLLELRGLFGNGDLIQKIEAALAIVASEVLSGNDKSAPYDQDPGAHDKRVAFIANALANPQQVGKNVLITVLGANASASTGNIMAVVDSAVIINVRDVIDELAKAHSIN